MGRRLSANATEALDFPAPAGLSATIIELAGEEYLIISFPQTDWVLPKTLTNAERDVVSAILRGLSTEVIAQQRGTSVYTVANQIALIFDKLGVVSRIELAALARSWISGSSVNQ